jgi:hypothetical protein
MFSRWRSSPAVCTSPIRFVDLAVGLFRNVERLPRERRVRFYFGAHALLPFLDHSESGGRLRELLRHEVAKLRLGHFLHAFAIPSCAPFKRAGPKCAAR